MCDWAESDFDGKGYHGIPKIVGEFWSPSTWRSDITWKKDIYEAIGIKEYWIITDKSNASVFRLIDGEYKVTDYQLNDGDSDDNILEIPCTLFGDLVIKIDRRLIY